MNVRCSVCTHSKVFDINALLAVGTVSGQEISRRFGLSPMAVSRHKNNCLPRTVKNALKRREAKSGDRLLDLSQKWIDHADKGMDGLVKSKDYRTLPGLLTAGLKAVETVARLEGRPGFGDGPQVNATLQIALVKLPALGGSMTAAPVIDVSPIRGHLASGGVLDGDCEETGETNCEG